MGSGHHCLGVLFPVLALWHWDGALPHGGNGRRFICILLYMRIRTCTRVHVPLVSLILAGLAKMCFYSEAGRSLWSYRGEGTKDGHLWPSHNRASWMPGLGSGSLVYWAWQRQDWFITAPAGVAQLSEHDSSAPPLHPPCSVQKVTGGESAAQIQPQGKLRGWVGRTAECKFSCWVVPCWLTLRPWTNCFFLNN